MGGIPLAEKIRSVVFDRLPKGRRQKLLSGSFYQKTLGGNGVWQSWCLELELWNEERRECAQTQLPSIVVPRDRVTQSWNTFTQTWDVLFWILLSVALPALLDINWDSSEEGEELREQRSWKLLIKVVEAYRPYTDYYYQVSTNHPILTHYHQVPTDIAIYWPSTSNYQLVQPYGDSVLSTNYCCPITDPAHSFISLQRTLKPTGSSSCVFQIENAYAYLDCSCSLLVRLEFLQHMEEIRSVSKEVGKMKKLGSTV